MLGLIYRAMGVYDCRRNFVVLSPFCHLQVYFQAYEVVKGFIGCQWKSAHVVIPTDTGDADVQRLCADFAQITRLLVQTKNGLVDCFSLHFVKC